MTPDLMGAVRQAMVLAAWLLSPVVVAALVAGAASGALAGVTGWREATLAHVIRVVLVGLAWAISFPWIADALLAFTRLTWGGG